MDRACQHVQSIILGKIMNERLIHNTPWNYGMACCSRSIIWVPAWIISVIIRKGIGDHVSFSWACRSPHLLDTVGISCVLVHLVANQRSWMLTRDASGWTGIIKNFFYVNQDFGYPTVPLLYTTPAPSSYPSLLIDYTHIPHWRGEARHRWIV